MQPIFPESVQFRVPKGFCEAVEALARREHSTVSEIIRRCVFKRLRETGLSIDPACGALRPPTRADEAAVSARERDQLAP
jgi:hypothetical protein